MANGDQLKALLRSFAEGDDRHFYSVAMQMAAHEAKQGHGKLAEEMRELINRSSMVDWFQTIPVGDSSRKRLAGVRD